MNAFCVPNGGKTAFGGLNFDFDSTLMLTRLKMFLVEGTGGPGGTGGDTLEEVETSPILEYSNNQVKGFTYDPQGSLVSRVDVDYGSGAIYDGARLYDAYGKELWATPGSSDEEVSYVPFRWKGQAGYVSDYQTGLVYCWHRYYDPKIGGWISRDPIGLEGGVNTYAYCSGDPVQYVDPEGLRKLTVFEGNMLRFLLSAIKNDKTLRAEFGNELDRMAELVVGRYLMAIDALEDNEVDPRINAVMIALGRMADPQKKALYLKSSDASSLHSDFYSGQNKCNLFAWSCYEAVRPVRQSLREWGAKGLYYSANASGQRNFSGWTKLAFSNRDAQIGDVVAFAHDNPSESGQITLYLGFDLFISSSDPLGGVGIRSHSYLVKMSHGVTGTIQRYNYAHFR